MEEDYEEKTDKDDVPWIETEDTKPIEEENEVVNEDVKEDDGVCDPKGDRLTKCNREISEENRGPNGDTSCYDDCDCVGGRWCSLWGWC